MRLRYKILSILFILLLVSAGLVYYANQTLIPVKLKNIITSSINERTKLNTNIESLRFSLTKGFVLTDIEISDPSQARETPFLRADEISFRIIYIPSLKRQRIIIPSISIKAPVLHLTRNRQGSLNMSPLGITGGQPTADKGLFSIIPKKLIINDGTVYFTDQYKDSLFKKMATNIEGEIGLTLPNGIKSNISAKLDEVPVKILSKYSLKKKTLQLELYTKGLHLRDYIDQYVPSEMLDMKIESATADIDAKIVYKEDKTYKLSGTSVIDDLGLRQKNVIINGRFSIAGELSGRAGDLDSLKYKGTMSFKDAQIRTAAETSPFITEAVGEVIFSPNHITLKKLTGDAAGTKVSLSGDVRYVEKTPKFSMVLKTEEILLSGLLSILPEGLKNKLGGIKADGRCALDIDIEGVAGRPETFVYKGDVSLKGGSFSFPYWPHTITDVGCNLTFEKQQIIWKELSFIINQTSYESYGRLKGLANPDISFSLKSEDLDLSCEAKLKEGVLSINRFAGGYYQSSFSLTGRISDAGNPHADIVGSIDLNLADTPRIFPSYASNLKAIRPKGIVRLKAQMNGLLKKPVEWELFAEGSSDAIYLWDLKFNDLYIDYRMKDRFIDIPRIVAYPYNGIISMDSRANLNTEERPYVVNIEVKDVDMHELVKDTKSKEKVKKVKGTLFAKATLGGNLTKKGSLRGNGWLQVADGYIWDLPLMYGIVDILFGISPEYITLTDAFGNFRLSNGRIYTEDFRILAKSASLLWVGSLGLDGTLDFKITGEFAEELVEDPSQPLAIAKAILREAGNLILDIRLRGTIKQPKYELVPFSSQNRIGEKVLGTVTDIFGDIIE